MSLNCPSEFPAHHKEKQSCPPKTVGMIFDPIMEDHFSPQGHYECPERVASLVSKLEETGLLASCKRLAPRLASDEELMRVHTREHIAKVDGIREASARNADLGGVFCSPGTPAAARMAAGCVTEAALQVLRGEVGSAMAVVRPPGHHAECDRAMGFCLFNNISVAAEAALRFPGVKRVLVLDWDVHHGNGIQHTLEDNPGVMYISLHRGNGFFPGTGEAHEIGTGSGAGFTMNIPWPKAGFGDLDYKAAFDLVIEPVVQSFLPDLCIVAAGYDAVEGDPLGNMRLTAEGYGHMTQRLLGVCGGRVVVALEGGYNVRATADCAAETMRVLLGGPVAWASRAVLSGGRRRTS
uniref:histone deacetylase n=1 Tax=Tetraselmis sp. GSL018 TaxID=582737 RepID=A0A061RQX0_9CHLO